MIRATSIVVGLVLSALAASSALAQSDTGLSRSGNVRFKVPAGWKKSDGDGYVALTPPGVPAGKVCEVRILHGFEYAGTVRAGFNELVELVKKGGKTLKQEEVEESTHPSGGPSAATAVALELPDGSPRLWVIWAVKPGTRLQALFVTTDDGELLGKHVPTVDEILKSLKFLNAAVLAAGEPPLTEYLVEEGCDFLEWALEVPFTAAQRQVFREEFIDSWKKKIKDDMDGLLQVQQVRAKVAALKPAEQDLVRKALESEMVDGFRKDKDGGRATKLILDIYDGSRKPIAAGEPPLTRQAAEAFLEATYFMAAKIEGIDPPTPTKEEGQEWARKLAEAYGKLDAEQRKAVSQMPLICAALRVTWNDLSEADRNEVKKAFQAMPPVAAVCAKFAEIKKQGGSAGAALELLNKMQRNGQTFQTLSNISQMMHQTNMNIIRNMNSGTTYRYVYRPR